jgi:hypothetical protein
MSKFFIFMICFIGNTVGVLAIERTFGLNQVANVEPAKVLEITDTEHKSAMIFTEKSVRAVDGELEFQKILEVSLVRNSGEGEIPQYVFIAHHEDLDPFLSKEALLRWGQRRAASSQKGYLHMVSVKEKKTSSMSIAVAIIKSTIGVFYYFHYVPAIPALIGSLFSSFHNLVFTAFPMAEQKLILNPLKALFGLSDLDVSFRAKNIDLVGITVHKLLNLGIVTTIINWEDLNVFEVSKDVVTSVLMYTIIKSLWKIHFDYQYKAKRISENYYFFAVPTLELVAYGIMPAVMLEKPWALAIGSAMAISGVINYFFRKTDLRDQASMSCRDLF